MSKTNTPKPDAGDWTEMLFGIDSPPISESMSPDTVKSLSRAELERHALTTHEKMKAEREFFRRELDISQRETQRLFQIANVSRHINLTDRRSLVETAVREIPAMVEAKFGALYLFDPERQELTLAATEPANAMRTETIRFDAAEHFLIWSLSQAKEMGLLLLPGLESFCRENKLTPPGVAELLGDSVLCFQLREARGKQAESFQGIFLVGRKPNGFAATDMEFVHIVGESLSAALYTARLLSRLESYAFTDNLTGLTNRHAFHNALLHQTAISRRYGQPFSLAYLDLDFFKRINDTYGHSAGDDVLREAGRRLKTTTRQNVDVCTRYGGEEFVVLTPQTNLAGARTLAGHIRQSFANTPFNAGGQAIPVTCSIGVAEHSAGETPENFLERADAALYRAKQGGRNRVETAEFSPANMP